MNKEFRNARLNIENFEAELKQYLTYYIEKS